MTATQSPRKDRAPSVRRQRGFGWGWLALCATVVVLLVWLLVRDGRIEQGPTRSRKLVERERPQVTRPSAEASAEATASARTLTDVGSAPQSANPASGSALSNTVNVRKTPL